MKRIKNKTVIMALTFGFIIAGSATSLATVVAAAPEAANGRISGCYASTGALRVVTPGTSCGSGHPISWVGNNTQVTVNSNGTYGNAWGISSVTHTPASGVYDITARTSTVGCVETATLAFTSGQISAEGSANFHPNEIQVQTYDRSGNPADQTFQLIESCA